MNRRELAKNGFLSLCGALLGRKPERDTGGCTVATTGGVSVCWLVSEGGDYTLSDGEAIDWEK